MVEFASDERMQARGKLAAEFFEVVFAPDDEDSGDYRLAFVSDEATLFDLGPTPEADVIQRVEHHYGVTIGTDDFVIPFWQLLDRLEIERR